MTTQQLIIETNLKAQINEKDLLPLCLFGSPGIGKTSVITQATKNIKSAISTVAISSVNYEFASGLPTFSVDTSLDKYSISGAKNVQATIWTIPELIMSSNRIAEQHGSCVILLDDIHTMDKTLENVMYQLLLERRLGDYKLHPNIAIIAAMNHSKESGGGSFNSAAVKSRLTLIPYVFNFEIWYEKFGRFFNPVLSSFIKTNPQYVNEQESKTLEPSGSARSWTKLNEEFNLYTQEQINQVYRTLVAGVSSTNATYAFEKHIIYYNKLDFTTIVKNKIIPTLVHLSELDKVLWANIIHSIITLEDSLYLIDLLNKIRTQEYSDTLVGFLSAEIYTQYLKRENNESISLGQNIIIDTILNSFDSTNYNLSKTEQQKYNNTPLNNTQQLLSKISEYINS